MIQYFLNYRGNVPIYYHKTIFYSVYISLGCIRFLYPLNTEMIGFLFILIHLKNKLYTLN